MKRPNDWKRERRVVAVILSCELFDSIIFIYPGFHIFSAPMVMNNFIKFVTVTLQDVWFLEPTHFDCRKFLKEFIINNISEFIKGYLDWNCKICSFEGKSTAMDSSSVRLDSDPHGIESVVIDCWEEWIQ